MKLRLLSARLAAGVAFCAALGLDTACAQTVSPDAARPGAPALRTVSADDMAGLPTPSDVPRLRRLSPDPADASDPWAAQVAPSFGRPLPVDGDAAGPPPEPEVVDGVVDAAEPPAPVDGVDGSLVDTRSDEEAAPFEMPRAPEDRAAFVQSIEPDPLTDRRPQRLFRFEPYDPIGVRVGTFVLYPEAEIGVAAFDNVFRSSSAAKGDVALETRPGLRAVSDWGVHALEVSARGLGSFHTDNPSEDDRAWTAEARGRLDVTRRTRLETIVSHDVAQETRGTVNTRSGPGSRADIATDRAGLALTHRFNRLTVQLRGALTERDSDPTTDAAGAYVSNDDRDMTRREAAVRASWEFKPELSIFAEAGTDDRSYKAVSAADGISRNSSGERIRTGVAFGSSSRTLRGEVSIGTASQRFDDGRLPAMRGIIVDADLAWRISGLTSLRLSAASDVGESTVAGSGGAFTRTAAVELRHALRRHLIATGGVRFTRADYEGVRLVEDETTTSLALEQYLSREVTLFARYAHIAFATTTPDADYTANEIRVGVRLRR